jgi:hypothetical protein
MPAKNGAAEQAIDSRNTEYGVEYKFNIGIKNA